MKKIVLLLLTLVLIALGFGPLATMAQATPTFKQYEVTQTWYKDGGTLDNIWPQSTTEITCGGIKQIDTYTITSKKMEQEYLALVAGGVLSGPEADNKFNPHDYSVVLLPACLKKAEPSIPKLSTTVCEGPGKPQDFTLYAPENEGVIYQIDGVVFKEFVIKSGDSVTVTAVPAEGYYFPEGVRTSWTWNTNDFNDCGTVNPPAPLTGETSSLSCKGNTVTSFVQAYVWDEGDRQWHLGEKVVTTKVIPLTDKQKVDLKCIKVVPTPEPTKVLPVVAPVETPTPSEAAMEPVANTATLASTGAVAVTGIIVALLLIVCGTALIWVGTTRGKK